MVFIGSELHMGAPPSSIFLPPGTQMHAVSRLLGGVV